MPPSSIADDQSPPVKPVIQLDQVRRTFRSPGGETIVALDCPSLCLEPGRLTIVTGRNGSGKTTLLHTLAGLLRPDQGRVVVCGRDICPMKEAALDRYRARHIGYLLQGEHLLEGLTARENIMAAMLFMGMPAGKQRQRSDQLLERFDLTGRAHHRPSDLSGGERQRVAMARALANDPMLILADEPTSRLDRPATVHLVEELTRLCRDEGRSIITVTHHPEHFPGAHRVHVEDGRPSQGD